MASLNKWANCSYFPLAVLLVIGIHAYDQQRDAGVIVQSLMEYFIMAVDCLAMVGNNSSSGWHALLEGLETLTPINRRTRCYAYCFLRKAGIIKDSLAFVWSDRELSQFVSVLIKNYKVRGNFLLRAYFRCKHVTRRSSRCDNTILFLICLRCCGVSFSLDDEEAISKQSNYLLQKTLEDVEARRLLELNELEAVYNSTTINFNPEVTVLQGFRAEAFWNTFNGKQNVYGKLRGDCQIPQNESSKNTGRRLRDIHNPNEVNDSTADQFQQATSGSNDQGMIHQDSLDVTLVPIGEREVENEEDEHSLEPYDEYAMIDDETAMRIKS